MNYRILTSTLHLIPEKGQEARAAICQIEIQYFGHNIAYSLVTITNFMAVLILTVNIWGSCECDTYIGQLTKALHLTIWHYS